MLDGWGAHPAVVQTLREAADALGEDIGHLIAHGSKEDLALTTNTQPAMLVAGVAAWRVWCAEGGERPAALAGHSLGEYCALVAAGVLTLAQAAPLVRLRARAMQEAVPAGSGAMAAVLGLAADKVCAVCAEISTAAQVVEAANFNDPLQTVIAGHTAAVERACAALKAAGARRALPLPVSAPFHSSLMRPAAEKLQAALADVALAAPQIPVINNIDVATPQEPAAIREALYRQAFGPVRWVECVRAMAARGITHLVECGPGKVLTGLAARIDPSVQAAALHDRPTLAHVQEWLAS